MTFQELNLLEKQEDDVITKLAKGLLYDEYRAIIMHFLQCGDRRINDFWVVDGFHFVEFYCISNKQMGLAVIFPSLKADKLSLSEVRADYPQYEDYRLFDYYADDREWAIFQLFYEVDGNDFPILRNALSLVGEELSSIHNAVVNAYEAMGKMACSNYYTAQEVMQLYDFKSTSPEVAFLRYRHDNFNEIEYTVGEVDALRGDEHGLTILARVIRWECESGATVTLELWDMDAGFEPISEGVKDLIDSGQVKIHKSCNIGNP